MKSITVKNAADVKAALDVLDAPAEKAISILQNALVMLDDTEKLGGVVMLLNTENGIELARTF